jgi:FRG domain
MAAPEKVAEELLNNSPGIPVKKCDWAEYHRVVDTVREETPKNDAQILYRGQRCASWALRTTLERATQSETTQTLQDYYQRVKSISKEVQSVTGKRWQFQEYAEVSDPEVLRVSNLEYLTYLRHHGFPSPLLDWTRSPYIAAFFAFCDADSRSTDCVAVFALIDWRVHAYFDGAARIFRTGDFLNTDERHYSQQADYTLAYRSGYRKTDYSPARDLLLPHEDVAKEAVGIAHHGTHIIKIEIPACERKKAMAYFADHNINRHTLFGDEDSFIKSLADAEFIDF